MMALFIKITAGLFFAYISIDAFVKIPKINKEVEDDLCNPRTGKVLKSRAIRSGVIFALLALISFGSLFLRVAPLGE
ncbi:MAG: hypothetical protein AB1896_07105 [Thermodesulfobacteriota bacterium]